MIPLVSTTVDANPLLRQVNTSCHPRTELAGEIAVGRMLLVWRDVMDCKESTFGGYPMGLLRTKLVSSQKHEAICVHQRKDNR